MRWRESSYIVKLLYLHTSEQIDDVDRAAFHVAVTLMRTVDVMLSAVEVSLQGLDRFIQRGA